jgi:unsaturated chondroitin disaccharide hydrolase
LADQPKTYAFDKNGDYSQWPEGFFEIGNWTSSFFTGMALIAFESTKDLHFLKQVNRLSCIYAEKVSSEALALDTMHDLGFLYSLYSVGLWKITGSNEHRAVGLKAADQLAKRYVPNGEYIRAWGRMNDDNDEYVGLAIIDCMMNLPLLFWASQETGNAYFKQIAAKHADTTAKCFIRADDSVCHAYRFDVKTGKPAREDNYCGAGVGTHWARGTAWAIYGFALAYRFTQDTRYLDISKRLAKKFISLLDAEIVPVWDFKTTTDIRDSSAASVAAAGLYELSGLCAGVNDFSDKADLLLNKLSKDYVDYNEQVSGVLARAQVGDGVGKARSAYTSWGDYFLMEALARRLYKQPTFW